MNTFGRNFRVSIFGESHGECVGVLIDGVPAGISLKVEDFLPDINRRRSGACGTTPRRESDLPKIISGIYNYRTTGAPLTIIFENSNTRSEDYEQIRDIPRPGHADYTASVKFNGYNDFRGGGAFSGRLTLPYVAAGVVAKKILTQIKLTSKPCIDINAQLISVGGENDRMKWDSMISEAAMAQDSLGGIVECRVANLPIGLGEPFFDSVESLISHAIFAIPGVRGIEFGDGFRAAAMRGSEHNDPVIPIEACQNISKNGAGGINGGLTNGREVVFRVAFKPTSSIGRKQQTYDFKKEAMTHVSYGGRHDVCFALRTPVIVEAAVSIVFADLLS